MIIDKELEFADGQAFTTSVISTNVIDLGGDFDVGPGKQLWVVAQVDVALDFTTGDETYQVDIETDDNAGMASATVLGSITFNTAAERAVGAQKAFAIPPGANEQYLAARFTTGGTTPTGTMSVWLTDQHPDTWVALPNAL